MPRGRGNNYCFEEKPCYSPHPRSLIPRNEVFMAATEGASPVKTSVVSSSASTSASGAASFAGRLVKQFRIAQEIGEGPNGRVFAADDTNLRRPVALKLIPAKSRD